MNFISKLLILLLITSFCCISCGDETDKTSDTEPIITPQYKHNDNTVRFRLPADARYMNPGYMAGYEFYVLEYIFPYLMDFDPVTAKMTPFLIKSLPEVKGLVHSGNIDGQAITFELLEEAVWDDGKPVTGYDYAFTIQALFNPKVPSDAITPYLEHIYDIVVDETNPKKFTVLTREKYILAESTLGNMVIMPRHIYDPTNLMEGFAIPDLTDPEKAEKLAKSNPKIDEFAKQFTSTKYNREVVVGCGPYRFVEWVDKQKIVLTKKKNWWGDKLAAQNHMLEAKPDTIIFMPIKDDNAVIAAIKDEALDVVTSINSNLFDDLKKSKEATASYNFFNPETYNFFYTILNRKNPKLADKRVRRALAHILEIEKLVEVVYGGYGKPVASPFPPEADYYRKDLQPIPYDLQKAAALLDDAGWKDTDNDGVRDKEIDGEKIQLSLTYLSTGTLFSKNFAATMKDNGAKVGIEIKTEDISFGAVIRERLPARDFEMAGMQGAADPLATMDPKQIWHTDSDTPSGSNRSGFGTPESDALIEQIRVTLEDEKRNKMMGQLQKMIYDDQPWLMLFAPQERVVIHKRFKGTPSKVKPTVHPQHLELIK